MSTNLQKVSVSAKEGIKDALFTNSIIYYLASLFVEAAYSP